jgi:hypothetical protein
LLQPLQVPEWLWEEIAKDFIVGLPRTQSGYDSIWVIVDQLNKLAHFIPVKPPTLYRNLQSCICRGWSVCMECQKRLCLIEELNLL